MSVYRSKCVSKAWHHLISSNLVKKKFPFKISGIYSNHSAGDSEHQYAFLSDGKFVNCNPSFFPFHSDSRIISCCNGLLFFHSLSPQVFHVCNPVTKRWLTLPSANKLSLLPLLVFDPCLSSYYIVISFAGWRTQGAELEVFSSETGKFTMSPVISCFGRDLYILSHPHCIVCIHLETMTCQQVELPEPERTGAHLGKNRGYLCYYAGNECGKLSVWMLDNHLKAITDLEPSMLGSYPESDLVS